MTDIHSCSPYCDRLECVKAQRDEMRAELERLRAQEPAGWTDICGAVARGWCHPENARKEMDSELALAIADEVQRLWGVDPPAQPAQRMTDEHRQQLVEVLRGGRQCDEDGVEIIMSRQACCEAADIIESAIVPQWQPIETAPKDELILVGPTKRMGICAAMHHSRDGWVTETTNEWMTMYTPTHWMPLPAAPKD